jgi:hypothetical protein
LSKTHFSRLLVFQRSASGSAVASLNPADITPIFCPAKEFVMNFLAINQWFIRRWLATIILAAISFCLGYWFSDRRLDAKVSESAQGQVKEFVTLRIPPRNIARDGIRRAGGPLPMS